MHVLPGLRPELEPTRWLADDGLARLSLWVDAVVARPSCVDTLPPTAELTASYQKLLERFQSAAPAGAGSR